MHIVFLQVLRCRLPRVHDSAVRWATAGAEEEAEGGAGEDSKGGSGGGRLG